MSLRPMSDHVPGGWLAFELSILRRLQFRSVANPYAGEPDLEVYLKRWGARVSVNDAAQWAWVRGVARVENNTERLTEEDVEVVLDDAYVPRHKLYNPALRRWFGETDAWWFDNVRANADKLSDERRRALALHLGMMVGDYVHSFDDETRELRQPLSRVFRRLWESEAAPVNNNERNSSANKDARVFLSKENADLLFLRLPHPSRRPSRQAAWAWREEWVRGNGDFWDDFEAAREGRLGARAETRQQYLRHVEELLGAATHFTSCAVAHVENGLVSTDELVEIVRRTRRVGTIYTKDFSELTGARAVIITA